MTEPRVHREIERKLDVPARFRLPSLSGAGNGIGEVHRQPTLRLTAAYYDTADLRLARHRITLRRRTGGGDDGWHLKLPHADEATRDEVQLPLRTRDAPPVELTTLVLGITRGAPLLAVATLRTERRPSLVFDEHGRAALECTAGVLMRGGHRPHAPQEAQAGRREHHVVRELVEASLDAEVGAEGDGEHAGVRRQVAARVVADHHERPVLGNPLEALDDRVEVDAQTVEHGQ